MEVFELVLGVVFVLLGLAAGASSLREPVPMETGSGRFLVALHDASKAGFWLTLGGFFLMFALLDEPQSFHWFALVPLGMAALRLATAYLLSRT